jgi:hypothetical protein
MYVTEMYDIAKSGINNHVSVFGYYFRTKFTGGNVWRLDATKNLYTMYCSHVITHIHYMLWLLLYSDNYGYCS